MRNSRAAHPARTFRFTRELGVRLRELRETAGLSLVELAHVMGRRPGYGSYLGRLEAGRVPFPSFALVADLLRACRASFADLLPVLGEYTSQPPVRETRVREQVLTELLGKEAYELLKYDRERGEQLGPGVRVRAASKQARAAAERRLLDSMMMREVNRLGVKPTASVRLVAYDYARMVWRAMSLTERDQKSETRDLRPEKGTEGRRGGRKRGRPRKTRGQRLREARVRILKLAPHILPARALDHIRDEVIRLFEDVRRFEGVED